MLVSGGIDDLCLKYFVEAGAMAIRRCKKQDLKRIARATGGEATELKIEQYLMDAREKGGGQDTPIYVGSELVSSEQNTNTV